MGPPATMSGSVVIWMHASAEFCGDYATDRIHVVGAVILNKALYPVHLASFAETHGV